MMTIEWVREHASMGVLRVDLTRKTSRGGDEGLKASLICSFWDEEGSAIAHIQWEAMETGSPRVSSFKYCLRQDEWATFIGDVIASWDTSWRTMSERQCRLGLWEDSWNNPNPRCHWQHLAVENLLTLTNLALMEGAVSQYDKADLHMDARSVLEKASKILHGVRNASLREFASLTAGV